MKQDVRPVHEHSVITLVFQVWEKQLFFFFTFLEKFYHFSQVVTFSQVCLRLLRGCVAAWLLFKCQATEELFLSVSNSDLAKSFYFLLCGLSVFLEANLPV